MSDQLLFDYDTTADTPQSGGSPTYEVEVIRSARRKKSSQARLIGNRLVVRIPAHCTQGQEDETVAHFVSLFQRRSRAEAVDLTQRSAVLAKKYHLPSPSSIRWVSNQRDRWGSCTPAKGSIRLSDRMSRFPLWVIDYVIVHELAHLVVSGHGRDFWELVEVYPLTERARGFLIAQSAMDQT